MISRLLLVGGVLLASLSVPLSVQAQDDDGGRKYVPPEGEVAPVAPPLQKGSPLDHLAHDPKLDAPTVGYREGKTSGSVVWIGHRLIDPAGGQGWGWIRKSGESWKWITVQETPGAVVAPHRKLSKADGDLNWEYKLWGHFAAYQAYDPKLDEMLPVFVLEGYEVIGLADPLPNKVGPSNRVFQKKSGASSRSSSPILSDPGVD